MKNVPYVASFSIPLNILYLAVTLINIHINLIYRYVIIHFVYPLLQPAT